MISRKLREDYDVLILGGGLAGLSLALHCRQEVPNARIAVLEKNAHPVPEAAFKVGESTVEVGANYFANILGLKDHIEQDQLPKLGLRFFFPAGDNSAIEPRLELGGNQYAPAPSYQLDRGRFENFLAEQCLSRDIDFIDRATVKDVRLAGRWGKHAVRMTCDGDDQMVQSRWIADASGRAAILKRMLGLQKPSQHKANAVWFRIKERIKVDDWSDDLQWQAKYSGADRQARWYSTNHLMGQGYWVWLIPLASGSTSIGIVADERFHPLSSLNSLEKALLWLDRHEPQCAEMVRASNAEVQDFLAVKHYATECKQVFSSRRWGIVGEAGFFLDPFYSPGSDFIAFGNTLLCDLIKRDLRGGGTRFRSFLFDRIYKRFIYGTLHVYQDQYALFGNHQVMPVKILWDYLVYWSLTGFVTFHGRTCDSLMYLRHMRKLERISRLNRFMQHYFRHWHEESGSEEVSGCVDTTQIPLIREMNQRLLEDLDNKQYGRNFAQNVVQVETLFWEIIDHARVGCEIPFKRPRRRDSLTHQFRHVFEVTSPQGKAHADGRYSERQIGLVTRPGNASI